MSEQENKSIEMECAKCGIIFLVNLDDDGKPLEDLCEDCYQEWLDQEYEDTMAQTGEEEV